MGMVFSVLVNTRFFKKECISVKTTVTYLKKNSHEIIFICSVAAALDAERDGACRDAGLLGQGWIQSVAHRSFEQDWTGCIFTAGHLWFTEFFVMEKNNVHVLNPKWDPPFCTRQSWYQSVQKFIKFYKFVHRRFLRKCVNSKQEASPRACANQHPSKTLMHIFSNVVLPYRASCFFPVSDWPIRAGVVVVLLAAYVILLTWSTVPIPRVPGPIDKWVLKQGDSKRLAVHCALAH